MANDNDDLEVTLTEDDLLDEIEPVEEAPEEPQQPEEGGEEPVEEPDKPQEAEQTQEAEPDEPEVKRVPVAAVISREREIRKLRQRLAKFEAAEQLGQEPPEKPVDIGPSPFEKWETENAEVIRQDPSIAAPYAVLKADREWQSRRAQVQEQANTVRTSRQVMGISLHQARVANDEATRGKGLDFDTITSLGATLLTNEDKTDIAAVPSRAGSKMYELCRKRLIEARDEETLAAIRARRQVKAVAPKPGSPPNQPIKKAGNPPTREEALRRGQPRSRDVFGLYARPG